MIFQSRLLSPFFALVAVMSVLAGCGGAPSGGTVQVDDGVTVISFVSASPDQIGLKGQGGIENSVVTFKVTDTSENAIVGAPVTFTLDSTVGGATLLGNRISVPTGLDGTAAITVQSGTVSTVVRVSAQVTGTDSVSISPDITISTGIPVASLFSMSFDPSWFAPETLIKDGVEINIQIIAGDQFGNPAFDGTRVSFWSPYYGAIAPSCTLSDGSCTSRWISASGILTEPANTRWVPILAYANGGEAFTDLNGNNMWDLGEPFTDLGEAFLDANEDGVYNLGEFFVDSNQNEVHDEGNGVYDGPCVSNCEGAKSITIWRQGRIFLCGDDTDTTGACANNNEGS